MTTAAYPDLPLGWREGQPLTRQRFEAEAAALAGTLPERLNALNLCRDRYAFMLLFVAVCRRGGTNLLPASEAPEMLARLSADYVATRTFGDEDVARLLSHTGATAGDPCPGPIPSDHLAAIAFTSGSSGTPSPHPKTWGALTAAAARSADVLYRSASCNIVATVPPQHMYGLEFSVLAPLIGRAAVHAGKPFYPRDIVEALRELPPPRMLLTTPVHLRALVTADIELPELQQVVSATAPLDADLAAMVEKRFACQLHEIYGCTEAGSIATRRTTSGPRWRPHDGVRLTALDAGAAVSDVYLPEPVLLQDRLHIGTDGRFELLGRQTDLLKVAGKRASLDELNRHLLAIPGVEDGVVFVPRDGARPAAFAVAPTMNAAQLLDALARCVDAVFLPRPLRIVHVLPRNEVGKLPLHTLIAMLHGEPMEQRVQRIVPLDHPAFPGHFPGSPVLPGVVLLDSLLEAVTDRLLAESGTQIQGFELAGFPSVKFTRALQPGDTYDIRWRRNGLDVRFSLETGQGTAAQGVLRLRPTSP